MLETNSNKISMTIEELLYFLYFGVMFGARAIGLYEGMLIYNISLVIGMLFFGLKILTTKHTVLEYIFMSLFLAEALLVYKNSGEKGILLYFTMMLAMKGVSRKRVEKFACILLGISFTVLTFLTSMNIVSDITLNKSRQGFGEVARHSLGYPYPNTLMTSYIIFIILLICVIREQSKKQLLCTSIFLGYIGFILFLFSTSNTGIIVTIFYLLINFYLKTKRNISKFEKILVLLAYPLCLFIAIPLPLITLGNEKISSILNSFTHTRWKMSQYYLTNEHLSLFGSRFKEMISSNGYPYMIDSSFLYSFIQVGLITFVIVTILHIGTIVYHVKKENKPEIATILTLCLLGLSDPFLFNLSYKNILFLYVGEWIWELFEQYQHSWNWNKEIQIVDLHILTINIPQNKNMRFLKKSYKYIVDNCIKSLMIYFITSVSLTTIIVASSWNSHVNGTLDTIHEWDYFRYNIAVGHWVGLFVLFIVALISTLREQTNRS